MQALDRQQSRTLMGYPDRDIRGRPKPDGTHIGAASGAISAETVHGSVLSFDLTQKGSRSTTTSRAALGGSSMRLGSTRSTRRLGRHGFKAGGGGAEEPTKKVVLRDEAGRDVTPQRLSLDSSAVPLSTSTTPGATQPVSAQNLSSSGIGQSELGSLLASASVVLGGSFKAGGRGDTAGKETNGKDEKPAARGFFAEEEEADTHDPNRDVTVVLTETPTMWLFELPALAVAGDSDEAHEVERSNTTYTDLVKAHVGNSDMFMDRPAQTFNTAHHVKEVQSELTPTHDAECEATGWSIFDAFTGDEEITAEILGSQPPSRTASTVWGGLVPSAQLHGFSISGTSASMSGRMSIRDRKFISVAPVKPAEVSLDSLPGLLKNLKRVERAVLQNIYHTRHALYRKEHVGVEEIKAFTAQDEQEGGDPAATETVWEGENITWSKHVEDESDDERDEEEATTSGAAHLWTLTSPQVEGYDVTAMSWHPTSTDVLAVGYGHYSRHGHVDKRGILAVWSLANPDHPEVLIPTLYGVTALAFSPYHGNLVSVGLHDGTVAVYDVHKPSTKSSLESSFGGGKHMDAVWEIRWLAEDLFVSLSADGHAYQWFIKKGLEMTELMRIKRVAQSKVTDVTRKEALISRLSAGLCCDFSPVQSHLYLIGTEEGLVHKCSRSYNEQFLETYSGHLGPVYQVRWSPFDPDTFLSAGADWTIRLWKQTSTLPCITLQLGTHAVLDACWSSTLSTVFVAVTADGRIDIWDLAVSTVHPVIRLQHDHPLTSVLMSKDSTVVVTGDCTGRVSLFKLSREAFGPVDSSASAQQKALQRVLTSNV
eukprot:TRINITY_DN23306_c0_g1_i1.p1 TRINITY_DN23306_c0_g1~~TRINITY_DN23306_c0_g1_i1.p1  ORF type:complete len:884 (-),score=125.72 TRINITY_DN23306_c0_g1_i1:27-2492(-)